jgi:hypothetical protein
MGKANQQNPLGEDAVSDYIPQNSGALGVAPSGTPGDELHPYVLGGGAMPPGSGVTPRPVVIGGPPNNANPYPYTPPPAYKPPYTLGGGLPPSGGGVTPAPVKVMPDGSAPTQPYYTPKPVIDAKRPGPAAPAPTTPNPQPYYTPPAVIDKKRGK